MTKQQFDNYKFSAKTEVKVCNKWEKIYEVDFDARAIAISGCWINYSSIEDIRN